MLSILAVRCIIVLVHKCGVDIVYTCIKTLAHSGLAAIPVDVEADFSKGMPSFDIVGLGDTTIREAKDRIRAAFRNSGFEFPVGKIVVNLAPANIPKAGSQFDLAIFIALLAASGQITPVSDKNIFLGEVSINGALRPVRGVLAKILYARENGYDTIFVPEENRDEASAVGGISVYPAAHVLDVVAHLSGRKHLEAVTALEFENLKAEEYDIDFANVYGQGVAKRAAEVAAAGGHNLMLIGPPGSGKSMIARRMATILPELTFEEAIELTKIRSVCEEYEQKIELSKSRPFRSPHHNASLSALVGGGAHPSPGEISLAHRGIMFLDEVAEFPPRVLEALRQPMEDNFVTISRVAYTATYPCDFQLVAAMNPCKCGYFGHPERKCTCSPVSVTNYLQKISGPLLDRFDMHVEASPVSFEELSAETPEESSAEIRKRVVKARNIALDRFRGTGITCNASITPEVIRKVCVLTADARAYLEKAFNAYSFSARIHDRILKVARTIADLDGSEYITTAHVAEAVQYRLVERKYWNR